MDSDILNNPPTEQTIPLEFSGTAREYFSIWIVNILLTILTLGIYSAWAKVRTYRYFYGNTRLDDSSFRYLASPVQILKGRIIAVVFFAAYYFSGLISPMATGVTVLIIGALIPAMVVMSMSFQLRNTSYRNIKFNFQKNFKQAYKIFFLPLLLVLPYLMLIAYFQNSFQADAETRPEPSPFIFLLGVFPLLIAALFPLWQYMIIKFKATHAYFGQADFSFHGAAKNLYAIYFGAFAGILLIGLLVAVVLGGLGAVFAAAQEDGSGASRLFISLLGAIAILPLYLWMFAYIQTKKINFIFGNLGIAQHRVQSELKVSRMLYLYVTNTLGIAVSLGLLIPWAKIRTARYRVQMTSVAVAGDLENFIGAQPEGQSAFGEEMGEVFDMDLGF